MLPVSCLALPMLDFRSGWQVTKVGGRGIKEAKIVI